MDPNSEQNNEFNQEINQNHNSTNNGLNNISPKINNFNLGSNFFGNHNHGSNFGLGAKRPIESLKANNLNNNLDEKNNKENINKKENNSRKLEQKSKNRKHLFNRNGYNAVNYHKEENQENNLKNKLQQVKQKQKKEAAKKAITSAANAAGPISGAATQAALKTSKGEKYLDAYAKGDNHVEGISNVKREIKKDKRKVTIAIFFISYCLPLLVLIFLVALIFKNADSQIFSNDNGGTVESKYYIDDKIVNIFANYPGLYEKIMEKIDTVSKKYKVELDKYLVIATLVAPISNELIVPVNDGSCGEENCYYFKGESKTWSDFLSSWADQAELLAKMEMLTYINNENEIKVNCGPIQTMEQYAKNDLETNTFPWWGWLNPVNWFKGFRDAAAAEVNARCVDAKNGDSIVPTVRVLSIDKGTYYLTNNASGEYEYVKDPESGGVYFWNLVNKNGFIHEYLKDYLSDEFSDDPDKNYELNKKVILETVNYIYDYYESIRKDCNGYPVIKGGLDKIKFREDKNSTVYTLDFEDVFVGGSMLATYASATGEVAKAQAILTRSEAYNYIVEGGGSIITGTAKMGCWWWKYNPTYDPSYEDQKDNPNYDPDYPKIHFPEIYKAVTETRGIVVTKYGATKVEETEYDAFCPQTNDAVDGFYYLPDGQRDLPIEEAYFSKPSWTNCPCFKNEEVRPKVEFEKSLNVLTKKMIGIPAQTTLEKCWTPTGQTKSVESEENPNIREIHHGFSYDPIGHGRGVSQHGMTYFVKFGYDHEAVIKLFLERDTYGISFKRLEETIEEGECENHGYFNEEDYDGSGKGYSSGDDYGNSNYTSTIGGTALNTSLESALSAKGHSIQDLNNCIGERVNNAGYGTRAGVVEAAMGLLECTMNLTGGFTYPYDHYGGSVSQSDLNGKLGVNSRWGKPGGTGCKTGNCLLGLNCASFVRWSLCNGGMNMCSNGSTFAQGQFEMSYYPGGIKIKLTPGFSVLGGSTDISSSQEAVNRIKPGDVLFSNTLDGGNGHLMVIVGVSDNSITIAENGRKTRSISKNELTNSSSHTYSVLLLDDYYSNSSNVNNLSW